MATLAELSARLADGRTTSLELVEECLAHASDPEGEGERVYRELDADGARAAARAMDAMRGAGVQPSTLAGIPVSIKDLFDIRGQVTRAGSQVLNGEPARLDAPAVERWRQAGLVLLGRTNMTEFAFSGLGLNPHYGTPANPDDRESRRIPGGSSSGAAVSVADGMAHGALGTDTGGSCRIPAALCGLVGFKPTMHTVSRVGMVPLSTTLDSVGMIGRSVGCCAALYDLLREPRSSDAERPSQPPRLAVVRTYFNEDAEPGVLGAFERALSKLSEEGADLVDLEWPELQMLPEMNAGGGFAAAEAFAWHHELLAERPEGYDPRVLVRIRRGADQTARDLIVLRQQRAALIRSARSRLRGFDAFLCPTVPLIAPPIAALDEDDDYARVNLLMLRNPTVINVLDGCAISVPMQHAGEHPMGLMVCGLNDADDDVLRTAAWIEERL